MTQEQSEEPISTAAELCLTLIMILPELTDRQTKVRDFCRLYDIIEKRPAHLEAAPGAVPKDILSPLDSHHIQKLGKIIESR